MKRLKSIEDTYLVSLTVRKLQSGKLKTIADCTVEIRAKEFTPQYLTFATDMMISEIKEAEEGLVWCGKL